MLHCCSIKWRHFRLRVSVSSNPIYYSVSGIGCLSGIVLTLQNSIKSLKGQIMIIINTAINDVRKLTCWDCVRESCGSAETEPAGLLMSFRVPCWDCGTSAYHHQSSYNCSSPAYNTTNTWQFCASEDNNLAHAIPQVQGDWLKGQEVQFKGFTIQAVLNQILLRNVFPQVISGSVCLSGHDFLQLYVHNGDILCDLGSHTTTIIIQTWLN